MKATWETNYVMEKHHNTNIRTSRQTLKQRDINTKKLWNLLQLKT